MCFKRKNKYVVIAHCSDGDVIINNKGKKYCDSYKEAKEIKKSNDGFGCPIEIKKIKKEDSI